MSIVKNSDSDSELSSRSGPPTSVPRRASRKHRGTKVKGRVWLRWCISRRIKMSRVCAADAHVSQLTKDLGFMTNGETIQWLLKHADDDGVSDGPDEDAPEGSNLVFFGRQHWMVDWDGQKRTVWPVPLKLSHGLAGEIVRNNGEESSCEEMREGEEKVLVVRKEVKFFQDRH